MEMEDMQRAEIVIPQLHSVEISPESHSQGTSAQSSSNVRLAIEETSAENEQSLASGDEIAPPPAAHQSALSTSDQQPTVEHDATSSSPRWMKRRYNKSKSLLLMIVSFVLGTGLGVTHCALYTSLRGKKVGSASQQENILRTGIACAFLSQILFGVSVWQTYVQWIWRPVKKPGFTIAVLNDIFGADTSILPFLNIEMLRKFKVGSLIGLLGWGLILPPFFTPGTLSVYPSIASSLYMESIPYPTIANSTKGHLYSYSPSTEGDRYDLNSNNITKIFSGPRTILTLLSTALAALGQILPIQAPTNQSSTTLEFFGPIVRCMEANSTEEAMVRQQVILKEATPVGSLREIKSAYFAFVPGFDSQGKMIALADERYQSPSNASNHIWMAFERYNHTTGNQCDHYTVYQVCKLWNATYNTNLAWDNGHQSISGSAEPTYEVPYPNDKPGDVSNMALHAYSAFLWALSSQIIGSFGWDTPTDNKSAPGFGHITSPISHNILLGSQDLDVFFDYNERSDACQLPFANYTAQRQQDIRFADNRTLDVLISELSFNFTVSLLHNPLLTGNTTRQILSSENVNRYRVNIPALIVPYALESLFTLISLAIGIATIKTNGPMPEKKFQDILAAADDEAVLNARSPEGGRKSMKLATPGRDMTFPGRADLGG